MKATIRTGARIFKGAVKQITHSSKKMAQAVRGFCTRAKDLLEKYQKLLTTFYASFWKKKKKAGRLILINSKATPEIKAKAKRPTKNKKPKKPKGSKSQKTVKKIKKLRPITTSSARQQIKHQYQEKEEKVVDATVDRLQMIKDFYQEWEKNWGPALTSLDRDYLEHASFDEVKTVIANARLTLKSPYLKAVYNGLKDLKDISDLLEHDEFAKNRVRPVLKLYWDQGPETFVDRLMILHDKGIFPTRSGERMLNLDPRLVPEWLGLV